MGCHISILEIRNLPFECDAVLSIRSGNLYINQGTFSLNRDRLSFNLTSPPFSTMNGVNIEGRKWMLISLGNKISVTSLVSYFSLRWEVSSLTLSLVKILSERKQKMKTLVVVLLCSLALNVSCAEKTSTEAEHDREKRWDLPNIDVSLLLLFLCQLL